MATSSPSSELEETRARVVERVRQLRIERRWTQAQLARKLGFSQGRLSEIERGGGSFTAEQLIEVLRLFNVSIDTFLGAQDVEDELQNALARLGAAHLREAPGVVPSARVASVRAVIRETLLSPRSPRLLVALSPVVVGNLDALNLDVLHHELATIGYPTRLPWLVENVHAALSLIGAGRGRLPVAQWHRARVVLGDFIVRHPLPAPAGVPGLDHLDTSIRTDRSLAAVNATASEISKRWGVVTALQPADFAEALREADAAG